MPKRYYTVNGKRVPSVTTITGRYKDSGGLIHWAWKVGSEGKELYEERNAAAAPGNLLHAMVDFAIKGKHIEGSWSKEAKQLAETGFAAFQRWREQNIHKIHHSEVSLTHDDLFYGGTMDAVMEDTHNRLAVADWKCAHGTYPEYVVQVSAYVELWNYNYPDAKISEAHLLRFGKDHGDFHHHFFPANVIELGIGYFKLLRKLYDMEPMLKRVCR